MAAGCRLPADWLPVFEERMLAYAQKTMTEESRTAPLAIDLLLQPHEVSFELLQWFDRMRPFGKENPRPRVLLSDLVVLEARFVGRGEKKLSLRLSPREGGRVIAAVGENADRYGRIRGGDHVDCVGELRQDTWRGRRDVIVRIRDLKVR